MGFLKVVELIVFGFRKKGGVLPVAAPSHTNVTSVILRNMAGLIAVRKNVGQNHPQKTEN